MAQILSVSPVSMKKIDVLAERRFGIPPLILMENAGRESALEILMRFKKGKAAVFCGSGNNGGDGFVCARHLVHNGLKADVYLLGKSTGIKNTAPKINLNIIKKLGLSIREITSAEHVNVLKQGFDYDIIVDAIFGIGFKGGLPEYISGLTIFLNNTRKPIYALDVPSGVDAATGSSVAGKAIKAYKTITFGCAKDGLITSKAKPYVGTLVIKDIGIPRQILPK